MSRIPLVKRQVKTISRLWKMGKNGLGAYLVEDSHLPRVQLVEKTAAYVADAGPGQE
jgi:hypothetical protein